MRTGKKGDKVRFVGTPCARTEAAGLKVGDILTLDREGMTGKWICKEHDIVFMDDDLVNV